ncbi:sulfotransferase family protein [Glycomyces artemisiae]|uniref:Sulfotransferase family protein n=1 Tax=Glycomyces artemisiae TaxID=1076443 RepID=A0A2T0UFQ5_9ACTN|nr:sulfotransferase [Glycomyces artemisiae]PRY56779.1 sulfotransferase family protein [Glycomyces artemisiae]
MQRTTRMLGVINLLMEGQRRGESRGNDKVDAVFDKLTAKARKDSGTTDLVLSDEDAAIMESLRFLLHCWAATPALSGVGWRSAKDMVEARISNLLTVRRLQAQHPQVRDEVVERPIFVLGLPRTATTLTQHIIAGSDHARAPYLWEMYYLGLEPDAEERQRRIRKTQKRLDMTLLMSKTWQHIHPTNAEWPEEDYWLKFHATFHTTVAPLPGYLDWYRTEYDRDTDFRFVRDALQVLQAGRPRQRWVLKHPGNLFNLDSILRVFPDAQIVLTHRDPNTVMSSLCSMVESLYSIHLKRGAVDPRAIGRQWLHELASGMDQCRRVRAENARPGRFIDVKYHRLTGSPHSAVPDLFRQLDLPWGPDDEARLDEHLTRTGQGGGRDGVRRHEHSLMGYGLDPTEVDDAFGSDYMRLAAG